MVSPRAGYPTLKDDSLAAWGGQWDLPEGLLQTEGPGGQGEAAETEE